MSDEQPDAAPSILAIDTKRTSGNMEAKAILLGERIDIRGLEAPDVVSQSPLAIRAVGGGLTSIHRFGAIVFMGVESSEQERIVASLQSRIVDPCALVETELVTLIAGADDNVVAPGTLSLVDFTESRLLVVADALAKSVALADDERYVRKVFEQIEPFAQNLAHSGRVGLTSTALLKLLGEALVAQTRMVGRVEVEEKPDLLWDRPDLQRLYSRLREEYELDDRARALSRKLKVIEESASSLADVNNARRTLRLEIAVVALIAAEIAISLFEIVRSWR